ncbi:MAG: ABC transporter ATP-binding protein [Lachnospiraceae bacterium]
MNAKKKLEVNQISYTYHTISGETNALSNVSFDIYDKEFVSIVGPSGCGKSTLLNIIAGQIKQDSGEIICHSKEKRPFGYMLQHDHLLPWRTIYKNVTLGLEINHIKDSSYFEFVDELLNKYGLYDFKNRYPNELSGGMKQRAALIRTLALKPSILLLDEPFSALDYQTRLNVSSDIGSIIHEHGITAILVTHNISEAIGLSDKILVFSKRPSHIKEEFNIHLTYENETMKNYHDAIEYNEYFRKIWNTLKE